MAKKREPAPVTGEHEGARELDEHDPHAHQYPGQPPGFAIEEPDGRGDITDKPAPSNPHPTTKIKRSHM